MAKKPEAGKRPVVIRREEVVEGGHHGGAWKVAYADFVTAMMAFFLLMWLINATTEAQRRGLADYFTPNNLMSKGTSGNGQPFGGKTPFSDGSLVSDRGAMTIMPGKSTATVAPDDADSPTSAEEIQPRLRDDADGDPASAQLGSRTNNPQDGQLGASQNPGPGAGQNGTIGSAAGELTAARENATPPSAATKAADLAAQQKAARDKAAQERAEKAGFEGAAQQIREAVRADPAIAPIANQIAIDQTPEGLRIQLLDEEHLPMFANGSSVLNDRAKLVLQKIAPILAKLPEGISVSGHTDATPFHGNGKTNWELSSERANATRRLLVESGLPEARFRNVTGNADRDLLLPADPFAAANRRIAIVALRDSHAARS